ncbi:uncharacterized protein CANTADRAFT_27368 [Suhomyces tanzawaensis NRRL Y-17324]|uniref:RING-type domain-containing protein n=1 Tax=Suhomyces tanzawaensis NRRL Y-17324 TaxID=984487 RepID=A0A1E4SDR8_9ASCO|nr:uncharacterized protein CANTADRAFT_27368 [Suhomyces tanzawaensis NRRL Y-17324]ODV77657.1 hypothetical protein CANTADRAFT_27368 [Suhomyces tanzawaensis NRRL Y-17324]
MKIPNPNDSTTFGNALLLRVDGAIGAMSLSPNGRDAVLAGRRGLFIIDLDDPFTTPRWLHHITSWEVADVQWSPNHVKPSWCISTSNQKALLWDLARPSSNAIVNVLHRHTRAITDINFHPSNPEVLATCSIDTFILSWDMRAPRKPVAQWAEWRAGTTQVKWNHENPYEIASSHDNAFYIWDSRKGSLPLIKVSKAHNGKINGLDFSNGASNIITCSNDKTVKFWNLKTPEAKQYADSFNFFDGSLSESSLKPAVVLTTDYPVARARSLPFGSDKACGIMPLRGGEDAIHIVNYDAAYQKALATNQTQELLADPIHKFKGHEGPMKDFLWRTRHENYEGFESKNKWKDYQLVTWSSQDYDLKLWPKEEGLSKMVNYNPSYNKLLSLFKNDDLDDDVKTSSPTTVDTEAKTPVAYSYQTYCTEPPLTIEDIKRRNNGDDLSSMALYRIADKHLQNGHHINQLNHLDWISGVRMGRRTGQDHRKDSTNSFEDDDNPSNLGEEVSIVGHKFPKVRFEKISVSTGELVISLRGPAPLIELKLTEHSSESNDEEIITAVEKEHGDKHKRSSLANASMTSADVNDVEETQSEINNTTAISSNIAQTLNEDNQEQKLVFIRLVVKFPKDYPYLEEVKSDVLPTKKLVKFQKLNLVKFDIEETYELTSILRDEMLKNLSEISQFFTNKYKRFCLEPCLRYLMGDKIELNEELMKESQRDNNDDSIDGDGYIEVGTEGWADDLISQQPDFNETMKDDSSGEEDAEYNDLIPAVNDNSNMLNSTDSLKYTESSINLKGIDNLGAKKTFFDSTPVPKGCGATWSPTGQLVCFFIPKDNDEDEVKSRQKFNIFKFTDGGFSVGGNSHHHHHHHHARTTSDSNESDVGNDSYTSNSDSDNDDSDSASATSSDDSFANDWDEILQDDAGTRARIPGLFKTSVGLGNRYISKGQGESIKRLTSQGGTTSNYKSSIPGEASIQRKRREKKNKNIVGIFDFRHLLPDKYELACEYRVLGDAPEYLARYNSEIALKYGLKDISDVWKILELILVKEVQRDDFNPEYYPTHMESDLRVARNNEMMTQLVQNSEVTRKFMQKKNYRFYWGTHPLGHAWLIQEIFEYFEARGNIQMLAMLSCILFENSVNVNKNSDLLNVPIHTPYHVLPPPPSMIAMRKFNEYQEERVFSNSHEQFNLLFHDSFSTDNRVQDYIQSNHRNSSILVFRKDQLLVVGAPYAKSISSSFDIGSLKDSSPERLLNKKNIQPNHNFLLFSEKPSPMEMSYSKLSTPMLKSSRNKHTEKKRVNPRNTKVITKNRARPPPAVGIEMCNTDELDLFDDIYSLPLLHSQDEEKLKGYRELYANMLFLWGLPINRIKILKFNYPEIDEKKTEAYISPFDVHRCEFGIRSKRRQNHIQPFINSVTLITTSKSNAWNTNKRNILKFCVFCNLMATKNLVLCTNCEHVLHTDCASEWWSGKENNHAECPSGCGCNCLEHTI